MMIFLLIISSFVSEVHASSALVCKMGSYKYTGPVFSDAHGFEDSRTLENCHERKAIDGALLGQKHKENREKIVAQINTMKGTPECKPYYPTIDGYLEKLEFQKNHFAELMKQRVAALEKYKEIYDVQRYYAYAAAFNTTCSGQYNRQYNFLDLDTINKLGKADGEISQVSKNNEVVESCSDVRASGSADLNEFVVSVKKAQGENLTFASDAYGVPDHVILKTKSGIVLHDTQCSSGSQGKIQIPLSKLAGEKEVVVSVKNDCGGAGGSAWEVNIQCNEDGPCAKPREDLTKLLKQEVQYGKDYIDLDRVERGCFFFYDENILADLIKDGMIEMEDKPMENGMCETHDLACDARMEEQRKSEKKYSLSETLPASGELTPRAPANEVIPDNRPTPPIFDHISKAYRAHAFKRLGITQRDW